MEIFKSLNCIVCKAPFVPDADQPQTPRDLYCGKAMCRECFDREKLTKQVERTHQCKHGDQCFDYSELAYFLIEVLSQDSLKLAPNGLGYLLCKPFELPKCPKCHHEYANIHSNKSPFYLHSCNHFICTSCFEKTRHLNEKPNKDFLNYQIKCPVCVEMTITSGKSRDWFRSQLIDFLTELPEMTRQLEEVGPTTYRFCKEGQRKQPIEEMSDFVEFQDNLICIDPDFQKNECDTKVEDLIKSRDGDEDDDQLIYYGLKSNYGALIYFAIGWLILFIMFYLKVVNNRTWSNLLTASTS